MMPLPAELKLDKGEFFLDKGLEHTFSAHSSPRLERAVERFYSKLSSQTGMELGQGSNKTLILECNGSEQAYPALGDHESYSISVSAKKIEIKAAGETGILYALESLLQLAVEKDGRWIIPALSMNDQPRYPWRGVMIDACRHWVPKEVILRNLEAMATETGSKLSQMDKHAHARAGFMRHHAQQAVASLARLSQDMGSFMTGLQQRIEDFTTDEVELTSEAIRRRGEALGITALEKPSDREDDAWETRARHLIPRRVYRGPVDPGRLINRLSQEKQDDWHHLLKEHDKAPRVLPVVALFWTDGKRTLSQIAELVELETGHRDTELLVQYFEFLAQVKLIELKLVE